MKIKLYLNYIYNNEKESIPGLNGAENYVVDNFFMYLFFSMGLGITTFIICFFLIPYKSTNKTIKLEENKHNTEYLYKVEKVEKIKLEIKKLDSEVKKLQEELAIQ